MHSVTDNYLKAIFEGSYLSGKVSNKRLAGLLGVSPATTTEQVKKMSQKGLVVSRKYGAISLSEEGERRTEQLLKKLRLCEVWLANELDLSLDEIAAQAWKIANFDSQLMCEQLNEHLNFPAKTPFGASVQEPQLFNESLLSLNLMKIQQKYILKEYLDNQRVIKYLSKLGLEIGQEYSLEKVDIDFDMLLLSSKNKQQIMVNRGIAKYIYVEALK